MRSFDKLHSIFAYMYAYLMISYVLYIFRFVPLLLILTPWFSFILI